MPISWNEIKSRGKKSWKNDGERVAFLFELYQKYINLLSSPTTGRKQQCQVMNTI